MYSSCTEYRSLPEIPAGDEMLRKDRLAPQTHSVAGPRNTAEPSSAAFLSEV